MLVTLLGWKVAGWTGAIMATLALFIPLSLLCYGVTKMWNHYRGRHWQTAMESGLAPIGAGLILAGVFAIFRIAGAGTLSWAVAGIAATILAWRPTLNPLILLAGGAAAFAIWHGMVCLERGPSQAQREMRPHPVCSARV